MTAMQLSLRFNEFVTSLTWCGFCCVLGFLIVSSGRSDSFLVNWSVMIFVYVLIGFAPVSAGVDEASLLSLCKTEVPVAQGSTIKVLPGKWA